MEARVFLLFLLWASTVTADPVKVQNTGNSNRRKSILLRPSSWAEKNEIKREGKIACIQNYYPCTCEVSEKPETLNNIYVNCDNVSPQNVQEIFQRIGDPEISGLYYVPANNESVISIPKDFLGSTSVNEYITINTYYPSGQNLVIDPQAFYSSQNHTTNFSIGGYHLKLQTDFSFLDGFNNLKRLNMESSDYITAIQFLPPLPSLQSLEINGCTELNEFPNLTPAKPKLLRLQADSLDDQRAIDIVTSLVASNSADSLESVDFSHNNLTSIPNQLPSAFPNLNSLELRFNAVTLLSKSSLVFASPVKLIDLSYNALREIESGAFQGNFTRAKVRLNSNYLDRLEEGVFKEMLQQMVLIQPPVGFVNVYNMKSFVCGCDIAWLIRDNRHLLPVVQDGRCGPESQFPNSYFEYLSASSFADCP